ncbi:MAG: 50S ribosomal protein L7ae-like protein [Clostridiaceae bacterium]|nr:50S ribosomal protein L7ae-like protein [Clostridiaceae bacterium]
MLELLKKKERVVGIKQTKKAIEQDKLETVIFAEDADKRVIEPLKQLCEGKNIKIQTTESMKQLGKAAGIEVSAAVVGILKNSN